MSARHKPNGTGMVPAVRYLVIAEAKAAPGPAVEPPSLADAPSAAMEQPADTVEPVEQHEWAGDLIDDPNEASDPAAAFATFTGAEGEQAWLDKADDGTLTGWVRDADGSVYRYSDVDAWAVDVDDAQMTRGDSGGAEPAEAGPEQPADDTGEPAEVQAPTLFDGVEGKTLVAVRAL